MHKLRKRFLFSKLFDCINQKNMYYYHDKLNIVRSYYEIFNTCSPVL